MDALHLATAIEQSCDVFFTLDTRLLGLSQVITELEISKPYWWGPPQLSFDEQLPER